MSFEQVLFKNIEDSIRAKRDYLQRPESHEALIGAIDAVIACYRTGERLYIAGNGGSAADAQHLATEFVSKLARDRNPLPAEALTTDSSTLTAIGNDYGFDKIFSRQLKAKATPKDMFLGITTSGKSLNVLQAVRECRLLGVKSIVFAGWDGGDLKDLADYCVIAPGTRTSTIQELHIVFLHTLCECVEDAIFPIGSGTE